MSKNLTPLGREIRKHRIDRNLLLADMADGVGVSATFLSAVETGKKSPPATLVEKVITYLNLDSMEAERLLSAADESQKVYRLSPTIPESAQFLTALARRFDQLSSQDFEALRHVVEVNRKQ